MSTEPIIWVAALMTIAALSYLFAETEVHKAVEHIYVGTAAGYSIVLGCQCRDQRLAANR